jgi:SAM-dependent methyltransferase
MEGVITEISPNDVMYRGESADPGDQERDFYFWVGEQAVEQIRHSLHAAKKRPRDLERILDLPCGHGRVLRMLKANFPWATLTACDLDREAVDFCAQTFGATGVYGGEPSEVSFTERFDLIWCGSLLTHLHPDRWLGFLDLFWHSLAPGGLLVFTTMGREAAAMLEGGGDHLHGLEAAQVPELLHAFGAKGLAYVDYVGEPNYGLTLALPSRVMQVVEESKLRLVGFTETGWANHQDVVACVPT